MRRHTILSKGRFAFAGEHLGVWVACVFTAHACRCPVAGIILIRGRFRYAARAATVRDTNESKRKNASKHNWFSHRRCLGTHCLQ